MNMTFKQRAFRWAPRPARQASAPAGGLGTADLLRALAEHRVTVLVQPQVDLATGAIVGVETLARLVGEDGRLIPPGDFVPLAERKGLIRPLGRRLFTLACAVAARLRAAGRGDLRVAINLSALQLSDAREIGKLLDILAGSGVDPRQIEIELTESAAIRDFGVVHQQLQRFRALGATVAIDDFGTGFCSLACLLDLEVDRLKIDRRFVAATARSGREGLAGAVLGLGRELSLEVIAEGVETEAEAAWLRRHRCREAQGYLFSRPVTVSELLAELAAAALSAVSSSSTFALPVLPTLPSLALRAAA